MISENDQNQPLDKTTVTSSVLTLEHLSIAMTYNYSLQYFDDERELLHNDCKIVELREDEITIANGEYQYDVKFKDVKLIVRPKADLTKEINYKGEIFIPVNYEVFEISKEDIIEFQNNFIHYKRMKFGILQILLKWNFDIFNLTKDGLAISIHDVV